MCKQPSPELELFAVLIHGTGTGVNFLGLVYNIIRLPHNTVDVGIHGIAFLYHSRSLHHHVKQLVKLLRETKRIAPDVCEEEWPSWV